MPRRLGQHFLNSVLVARKISIFAGVENESVLEIGAGKGMLTQELAKGARCVYAVEIDPKYAASLRAKQLANVEVINEDFLKMNLNRYQNLVVVGNIPYSITTKILEKLTKMRNCLKRAILTLQKEFAHKLSAPPGSRNYLYISLVSQMLYSIEIHDTVPPSAFSPRPRVTSCIVKMQRNLQKPLSHAQLTLLKYIFTDRRHVLGKVLRRMGYEAPQQLANKRISDLTIHEALKLVESLAE
ncbi:MAG: 16S rRNA (adenine(1518)-N(6)/adenine(1519)-N(6))-dimethyltransferase RsmA [Nitrososphaerota archaeon]